MTRLIDLFDEFASGSARLSWTNSRCISLAYLPSVNRAANDWPQHAAGCHLLSVFQAATNN